jgi:monofunctional glycosyltransferase
VTSGSKYQGARWRRVAGRLILLWLVVTLGPVIELRWLPPSTSSFMLRAEWSAITGGEHAGPHVRYHWAERADISPQLALAAMAAEDQRFPAHVGFDLGALRYAWQYNQGHRRLRGGSTITQQTAKNLFLYPARSYLRKGLEAYFSVLIELLWPKRRILEVYLNIAQFGDGVYGAAAASEFYFHKPARQLTAPEAALLVAVLPNPIGLRVDRPSHFVRARRDWILRQMERLGGIAFLKELH